MRVLVILAIILISVDIACGFYDRHTLQRRSVLRKPKFFGIGIVRFENGVCTGADSLCGTCYTRRQCASVNGGTASGSCASGIGVCCVVQLTCGNITSNNNTYFTSPNFPTTYAGGTSCTLTIRKCNPDICQVRIDFLSFSLAQPNANGTCNVDGMTVIGGASQIPIICGENSGQHIYVDFNGDSDIQIIINTNSAFSFARSWNFKIAQIGCDCPTRAPAGCLMYYTALTGTVTSFNYGQTAASSVINTVNNTQGTRELANLNYGVCIEMQPGYCSIQWSQSSGDVYSFSVSGDTVTATGTGTVGTVAEGLIGSNCTTDFVVIPDPYYVNGTAVNSDRFCGNGFPTVTTSSKPFVLTVVTNGDDATDAGNRGFSLTYAQQQCTTAMLF